jgi:hypothetical protein
MYATNRYSPTAGRSHSRSGWQRADAAKPAFASGISASLGGYPGDDYKGGQMFNKIDKDKMAEDMVAAALWLKSRPDCTGSSDRKSWSETFA